MEVTSQCAAPPPLTPERAVGEFLLYSCVVLWVVLGVPPLCPLHPLFLALVLTAAGLGILKGTPDLFVSSYSQPSSGVVTPVSRLASRSASPGGATGLSTEHSSIYSWRYDEFDRANTQRVRQLFCDVDELLYEGKVSSNSEGLQEECEEWNGHSPHLRILGNQLEPPKEEGYEYVHRRACIRQTEASARCLETREDNRLELYVEGRRLAPGVCPARSVFSSTMALPEHSLAGFQEEEVYEAEGRIEEFLAYDVRETEDEWVDESRISALAPRGGIPPVSPHACIRDAVADEVFDDVWRGVVSLLGELLYKQWDSELTGLSAQGRSMENCSQILCEPSSHPPVRGHPFPPSRGSSTRSMFLWSNGNSTQDSSTLKMNLNGVMTIQAIPLQQRQHGFNEKPMMQSQRGASGLSRRPSPQIRLPGLRGRTGPCHAHAVHSNQVLRGSRLSTVAERLPSLPVSAAQTQRLPQIQTDLSEPDYSGPVPRHTQHRGRFLRGGMASVMQPIGILPPLREPTLMLESLSRPNTTHSYRSDTPLKRSFTPMDFASHVRTGRTLVTGDRSQMGVTGFSVGITCSTASGFSECSIPLRRRVNITSSTDADGGNTALLIGAQYQRRAASRFPLHGKKKLQTVMP
ncbi:protein FAM149A [Chanos chanos]|uniref:Protein FAM149A n=1 Tax=Chanos chanos TaxID=29144 RepID=A0A6J2UNA1_CHACN|nr:protein FAM149A [Chanos chanos]